MYVAVNLPNGLREAIKRQGLKKKINAHLHAADSKVFNEL